MKPIVIYYSFTGNTEKVAKKIGEELNAPVIKIEPLLPILKSYDELVEETKTNDSTDMNYELKKLRIDLDQYDTFFIGGPIWWYSLCPIVKSFLKKNDFTGKTVYPFVTNAGWLGHGIKDFERILKGSNIKRGLNIVFEENNHDLSNENISKIRMYLGNI